MLSLLNIFELNKWSSLEIDGISCSILVQLNLAFHFSILIDLNILICAPPKEFSLSLFVVYLISFQMEDVFQFSDDFAKWRTACRLTTWWLHPIPFSGCRSVSVRGTSGSWSGLTKIHPKFYKDFTWMSEYDFPN